MGDEDSLDLGTVEQLVDRGKQLIEVLQRDGTGVELAELDDLDVGVKGIRELLAAHGRDQRAVFLGGARDGAAGGDECDSHGLHTSVEPKRPSRWARVALKWMGRG